MSEPWFDAAKYGWAFGTIYGCAAGLFGGLCGTLAPKGKGRALVVGGLWLFVGLAVIFLAAGAYAYFDGQPYGIWYCLVLPGVLGIIIFPANAPMILKRYREAEERRMSAQDLE